MSRNCSTPATSSVAYLAPASAGGASPSAVPRGRPRRPAHRITPPPRTTRHRVKAHGPPAPARGRGRQWPDTARLCAAAHARATDTNRPAIVAHERRGGPTPPNTSTPRARVRVHAGRLDATRRRRATPASGASPHGRRPAASCPAGEPPGTRMGPTRLATLPRLAASLSRRLYIRYMFAMVRGCGNPPARSSCTLISTASLPPAKNRPITGCRAGPWGSSRSPGPSIAA